jgi:undecaprenyl-phosphate 4-deoxy-4-formamido-L-arabinose transferase
LKVEGTLRPSGEDIDVSVVIPAHNEKASLRELAERVLAALAPFGSHEVILVDDGSTDESWRVIGELAAAHPGVVGVRLQRNFGQHAAVKAGFARSRGRVVVTMDADLQNPPEEIPKLLRALTPDYDVAAGWREDRKDGWLRRVPSRLVNISLGHMTGVHLHDYGCMMRVYRRRVVDQLLAMPEMNRATTGMASWLGAPTVEVPIEHARRRRRDHSRYGFWRLLRLNFDILTGFSIGVLQFVSVAGIVLSVLGFGTAVFLAIWRIAHGSGPVGLTTFLAVLIFLAGAQVAAIGIVGEYVGRVFVQVQGRPAYVIRETTDERDEVGRS